MKYANKFIEWLNEGHFLFSWIKWCAIFMIVVCPFIFLVTTKPHEFWIYFRIELFAVLIVSPLMPLIGRQIKRDRELAKIQLTLDITVPTEHVNLIQSLKLADDGSIWFGDGCGSLPYNNLDIFVECGLIYENKQNKLTYLTEFGKMVYNYKFENESTK